MRKVESSFEAVTEISRKRWLDRATGDDLLAQKHWVSEYKITATTTIKGRWTRFHISWQSSGHNTKKTSKKSADLTVVHRYIHTHWTPISLKRIEAPSDKLRSQENDEVLSKFKQWQINMRACVNHVLVECFNMSLKLKW